MNQMGLTVDTLILGVLLVERVRSRSFRPLLPQDSELRPYQLAVTWVEHRVTYLLRR